MILNGDPCKIVLWDLRMKSDIGFYTNETNRITQRTTLYQIFFYLVWCTIKSVSVSLKYYATMSSVCS